MDREELDQWCERGILGLVLIIVIYSPLAFGSVRLAEFVVIQWLAVAVLAIWDARFWITPQLRLLWPPVSWAVLAFMGYAVVRFLTADIDYVARHELIRVLIYGFLFFSIVNNLHRQGPTQIVSLTIVFLAMGMALFALYQFLSNSEHIWGAVKPLLYRKRGSGPFINPNHLAGYLEMVLPLALTYTLTGRFGQLMKVGLGYAALAIFAGLVVTVSRGGWVASGISLVVFVVWLLRQRGFRIQALSISAALVALGALFLFKAQFNPKRVESLALASSTEDVRFQLWKPAWAIWRDHVWWGAGPGHFDAHYFRYRPGVFDLQFRAERVHNDYLNALVDWGLVGGLLILAAWVLFYMDVFRGWKYVQRARSDLGARRSNRASLVMGGSLGLLAILVHSFVDFNMHIPANALLATTLMALVSGHFRFTTERYWHTVRWPLRIPINAALIAGLLFLGQQAWKATAEHRWLARAAKALKAGDQQAALERASALAKAYAVEPDNSRTSYEIGEGIREHLRERSEQELPNHEELAQYEALAQAAIKWYQQSIAANPYDPLPRVGLGRCQDWLGQHAEAEKTFAQARDLDPNGYYTLAYVGWHYVQVENYAEALKWLERSLWLYPKDNQVANQYLKIVRDRIQEKASPR